MLATALCRTLSGKLPCGCQSAALGLIPGSCDHVGAACQRRRQHMIVIGIRGQREAARRDLVEHFVYLADSSGLATAECFLTRAEASFNVLAGQPLIGAPLSLRHPDLAGMRKWRVKDFDNHLIFYLPRHDGVAIVRVLQAAQDWRSLLGLRRQGEAANGNNPACKLD